MFGPNEEYIIIDDFGSIGLSEEDEKQILQPKNRIQRPHKWFDNYIQGLSFSSTAIGNVESLSSEIGSLISESTDLYEEENVWGDGRLRKGMVVGSIQSGKTASMMGVIGKCIDQGTKIVILLSGTKISLWHQTLSRFYDELDRIESIKEKANLRLILPKKYIIDKNSTSIDYSSQENSIRSAIENDKKPLVFVIPKIKEHIYDVASVLHRALSDSIPVNRHMLVIDDESDDASILDAKKTKTVPFAITRLWAGTDESIHFDTTANKFLYATYLAYTATPQANVLQIETNPLAPRDFLFAIETPGNKDSTITYFEPEGIRNYYTGGEIFYEQDFSTYPEGTSFCQELPLLNNNDVDLSDGLRAYIVGAAIHLLNSNKLYSEMDDEYDNLIDAKNSQINPFSMVYHPSAETPEHFEGKQQIVYWLNNANTDDFKFDSNNKNNQNIDLTKFTKHFSKNEQLWEFEINKFQSSIDFHNSTFDGENFPSIKWKWIKIRNVILEEIIPNIKIRVINSKAGGESRPKFNPIKEGKKFFNAPDKLSIFVAGNVLSRGLTIEGLAVSIFARSSLIPVADTQMQMQRWFGYRGNILPLCRVFLFERQLVLFEQYHQSDKSLKERISNLENKVDKRLENLPYILEGENFLSTLKTDTSKLPLRPSSYSQFGIIESEPDLQKSNYDLVLKFLKSMSFNKISSGGQTKGYVSNSTVSSIDVADFLGALRFSKHLPSIVNPVYKRWIQYAEAYSSDDFLKINNSKEDSIILGHPRCPYTMSAYLRFWDHVSNPENSLKEDLFVWPDATMWRDRYTDAPNFFVTIRSGSQDDLNLDTEDGVIKLKTVQRSRSLHSEHYVNNVWGTASGSANQYDDRLFDYHNNDTKPVPKSGEGFQGIPHEFRPSTHPAHLAIYFIKQSNGSIDLGIGIGIPAGSPDHIRAMRG